MFIPFQPGETGSEKRPFLPLIEAAVLLKSRGNRVLQPTLVVAAPPPPLCRFSSRLWLAVNLGRKLSGTDKILTFVNYLVVVQLSQMPTRNQLNNNMKIAKGEYFVSP